MIFNHKLEATPGQSVFARLFACRKMSGEGQAHK